MNDLDRWERINRALLAIRIVAVVIIMAVYVSTR